MALSPAGWITTLFSLAVALFVASAIFYAGWNEFVHVAWPDRPLLTYWQAMAGTGFIYILVSFFFGQGVLTSLAVR